MIKDTTQIHYITISSDTTHFKQPQFTEVDYAVGGILVGLWFVGLIFVLFIFKRP